MDCISLPFLARCIVILWSTCTVDGFVNDFSISYNRIQNVRLFSSRNPNAKCGSNEAPKWSRPVDRQKSYSKPSSAGQSGYSGPKSDRTVNEVDRVWNSNSMEKAWKSGHVFVEFRYDSSSNMDPVEVAARNAGEFFIDRISDEHRGKTQRRTNMEFLVSWKGYSAKDDTWEPYKAVCKTQAFVVDYCYANRLTSLVNKALRG